MTLYGLLWIAGGNDIIAVMFDLNLNYITYFMRVAVFVGPVIAFIITRRCCIWLQRQDEERLLHGYETGIIMRSPDGGYSERHAADLGRRVPTRSPRTTATVLEAPTGDRRERRRGPQGRAQRLRARLSQFWFGDNVQKPTAEPSSKRPSTTPSTSWPPTRTGTSTCGDYTGEYELDGTVADGHQFDEPARGCRRGAPPALTPPAPCVRTGPTRCG